MTIDQRRYVDIASGVIGATAVPLQKLDLRIMTNNVLVPSDSILEFNSAAAVADHFGSNSEEASLASAYFAYVSPAPVSRPRAIQFASHVTETRLASLIGIAPDTVNTIEELGIVSITLDWVDGNGIGSDTQDVDFTGVVSYADVADVLSAAFSNATFSYQQLSGAGVFVVMLSGTDFESASFDENNATIALGLSETQFDPGADAQTMMEAYVQTTQLNDSFGSAWFMNQGDLEEIVDVAELNASFNVKHQLYIDVAPADAEDYAAALLGTASVGLLLRRSGDQTLAILPGAIMSATDYTRTNATTNYMFRQYGVTFPAQVRNDLDANLYDPLRVNYYGRTAVAGSNIEFFQRGFLCGGLTAPVDMSVHANEQWLKAYIAQQWFTLLLSTRGVPANIDGEARMRGVVAEAVTRALNNGTILPGRTLTPAQIVAVTDASGDDLAWHDIRDKGYWYDVSIEEETGPSGLPEYVGKYTLIYGKGDWVRKVEGSHNLV